MSILRVIADHAWLRAAVLAGGLVAAASLAQWSGVPPASGPGAKEPFRAVTLVTGLEHPWGLAFLPDGRMLVTERPGRLRIVADGRLDPQPVSGLPAIATVGQGGLLDIALHPDYARNGWIYLSYAAADADGRVGTTLGRGRLQDHNILDWQELFALRPRTETDHHFGSRLVFDRRGYLYITLGDRGERDRAQDLGDHAGSVIRLHDNGRVPTDNPFADRPDARPEIFSYGHRNPQGAALNPRSGEVWLVEHGPQGGDEINIVRAGVNYGWPVITYGAEYGSGQPIGEGTAKEGMAQPLWYWTPSIAPSGMAFYDGDSFPQWHDSLFVGALKAQMLVRLALDGDRIRGEERYLKDRVGRIRDVRSGPDGFLYLLTDAADGKLIRLEPLE